MIPDPPSSPDGSSIPPRQRPSRDIPRRETTERELWDLEEEIDGPPKVVARPIGEKPEMAEPESEAPNSAPAPEETPAAPEVSHIPLVPAPRNLSKSGGVVRDVVKHPVPEVRRPSSDEFANDLEDWTDPEPPTPPPASPVPAPAERPAETPAETKSPPRAEAIPENADDDELSSAPPKDKPAPASAPPHSKLGLSKVEKIGLIALAVTLLSVGIWFARSTFGLLATTSGRAETIAFPVKGERIEIRGATTFWREPQTGENADRVRRGTVLIPVIELEVGSGSGAVRVFFRDHEDRVVGDAISRPVAANGTITLAATAGFSEEGMYAAYRTDPSEPWKVEVFEGATATGTLQDFRKILEMPVSASLR